MLQIQEVVADPAVLEVTHKSGEKKRVARIPFTITYLLQNCGRAKEGYAVLQTTHNKPPLYFCSIVDDVTDGPRPGALPHWMPRPGEIQRIPVGVWLCATADGRIDSLPDGLPAEAHARAKDTQVQVQATMQERCKKVQQPESGLEEYTRLRVALALQSLNYWNTAKKLNAQ